MFHDSTNTGVAQKMSEVSTGNWLARILANVHAPMQIISGPALTGTREGVARARVVGDDPVLLEKTKHVRNKKETMMQFFARTGIGAHQVRTLTKDALASLVDVATKNSEYEEHSSAAVFFQPKPMPTRFLLTD